jgi:hypothetical protein
MVNVMKKILITIFISLIVGSSFAFIIYKNINKEVSIAVSSDNVITYFQVGVFKDETNANNYMQKYNSSIIIKDKEYYRVIIAIAKNESSIIKLKEYFDEQKIEYFLKKETLNDKKFLNKLQEYEELLNSSKKATYSTIIKNILKTYEGNFNK